MIDWETLRYYTFVDRSIQLYRSEEVQNEYDQFKSAIKNIDDYIFNNIIQNQTFVLTKNKFPYDLTPNILHYVLWIHPDFYLTEEDALDLVTENYDLGHFLIAENEPQSRSVKGIQHFQVFIKNY